MRRSWGSFGATITTAHEGFQEHLALFALDQLPQLFTDTVEVVGELLEDAGIESDATLNWDAEIKPTLTGLVRLGRVPLVHANEWNYTDDGRLKYPWEDVT